MDDVQPEPQRFTIDGVPHVLIDTRVNPAREVETNISALRGRTFAPAPECVLTLDQAGFLGVKL